MIGDILLNCTLMFYDRDIPGYSLMVVTVYVSDINRDNAGYIYDRLYKQFWLPHDVEYILRQREWNWSRE